LLMVSTFFGVNTWRGSEEVAKGRQAFPVQEHRGEWLGAVNMPQTCWVGAASHVMDVRTWFIILERLAAF